MINLGIGVDLDADAPCPVRLHVRLTWYLEKGGCAMAR